MELDKNAKRLVAALGVCREIAREVFGDNAPDLADATLDVYDRAPWDEQGRLTDKYRGLFVADLKMARGIALEHFGSIDDGRTFDVFDRLFSEEEE